MIEVPYAPFGPRPGAADNRIFVDELEHYPLEWQTKILDLLQARGATGFCLGPGYCKSYDNQYPFSDWRDPAQADAVVALAEDARRRGLWLTLTIGPNDKQDGQDTIYWDSRAYNGRGGWRLDKMTAELAPVYQRLIATGAIRKIRLEWEIIAHSDAICALVTWVREVLGWRGKISYHTLEGHLWPGLGEGDLSEAGITLKFAAAGGTTIDLQGFSPTDFGRWKPPLEATVYDWQDGNRRVTGVPIDLHEGKGPTNGWGLSGPIVNCDGVPLEIVYAEGPSEDYQHYRIGPDYFATYREALSAVGAVDCEDGIAA